MNSHCCEKLCFKLSRTVVDGLACTKCGAYGECMCRCVTYLRKRIDEAEKMRLRFGPIYSKRFDIDKLMFLKNAGFVRIDDKIVRCETCGFLLDIDKPKHCELIARPYAMCEIHDQLCDRQ